MLKWYWLLFAAWCWGRRPYSFFRRRKLYCHSRQSGFIYGAFPGDETLECLFRTWCYGTHIGGISRDYLSSEFSLYNILFYCLPPFAAYMCGYFLKILIAAGSVILLAKDIYREEYKKYEPAAVITGLIYGFCRCSLRMGLHSPQSPLLYCCSGAFTEGRAGGIICSFSCIRCFLISLISAFLFLLIWFWPLSSWR